MEEVNSLLEKVRSQTNSFKPTAYSKSPSMPISNVSNISSDIQKPSFSEITPYSENTVYETLSSGEKVPMFENFIPGTDNQERLAQQQTAGDKWANGALKFATKTTNAVVGGTIGLVYGAGAAIADGSWNSIYDNDFSNKLNDLDVKLNYQLPNYYTKQEQDAGVFGQMGTANFWSDKFLGGLSFTAGAIISEAIWAAATGGTSLATLGARAGAKLARGFRWGTEAIGEAGVISALAKNKGMVKALGTTDEVFQAGVQSKKLAVGLAKAGEVGSVAFRTARSAGYEASVEALQYKKEAEENFYRNFASINGREPEAEDIAKFEKDNESAANTVFFTNTAIVGASNFIGLGHTLNLKSTFKDGISDFINKKAFGYGVDVAGKSAMVASRGQKIARNAFDYIIKPGVTEGLFEEGLQGVTNKTANKWIEHSYNQKHSNETFEMMEAMGDSMAEQYGSEAGWKDNMLGILIGIAGGSVNVRGEQKEKEAEIKLKVATANTYDSKTMQSLILPHRVQSANRMAGFSAEAKEAEAKGNITQAELATKSATLTYINSNLVVGQSVNDMVEDMSKTMNTITVDQWKEAGVEADEIGDTKAQKLSDFKSLANQWKTNKEYVSYMLGNKMVGEQNLDGTALEEALGSNFNKHAAIVEALTWTMTTGENANKIMSNVKETFGKELGFDKAKVLDIVNSLSDQSAESKKEVSNLAIIHSQNSAKRDSILKRIDKLNKAPKETQATESHKKQILQASEELLKTEQAIVDAETRANEIADKLNATKDYQKGIQSTDLTTDISGDIVTAQDLINLEDNINKFKSTLDFQRQTNPQRADYYDGLLEEYTQAQQVFLQNQALMRAFQSKDFKIENVDGWIMGKVKAGKAMNENTQEWFQSAVNSYAAAKAKALSARLNEEKEDEQLEKEVENNEVSQESLQNIADKKTENEELNKTELQVYNDNKEAIDELIKQNNLKTKKKSEAQINQEKIDALEAERRQKLAEVEDLEQEVITPTTDTPVNENIPVLITYNNKEYNVYSNGTIKELENGKEFKADLTVDGIKEINTKYNEELKAAEEAKQLTKSDIEAKKAEIEQRRREALTTLKVGDSYDVISSTGSYDGTWKVIEITDKFYKLLDDKGAKLNLDKTRVEENIKKSDEVNETKYRKTNRKEINAKYDAELKALEQTAPKETAEEQVTTSIQPTTNGWLSSIINKAKETYSNWVRGEYKREPSSANLQLFDNILTNPSAGGFNNILQQFYNGIRLASYDKSNVQIGIEDYTSEVNNTIQEVRDENGWHYRIPFGASTGKSQFRISLNVKGSKELIDILDKLSKDYGIYYKTPTSSMEWLDRHDPVTIYITNTNLTEAQMQELKDRVVRETEPHIRSNNGFGLYGENISEGVEFGEEATENNALELIKEAEGTDPILAEGVKQFLTSRNGKIKGSVGQQMAVRQLLDMIEASQQTPTVQSDIEQPTQTISNQSEIAELEKEKAEKLALIEKEINEIEEELRESSKLLEEETAVEDIEELEDEQKESVIVSNGLTITEEDSSENVTEVIERNNEEVIDNTITDNLSSEEIATIAEEEEIAVEDVEDFVKEEVKKAIKNKGNILTNLSEATKRIINRIVKFLLGGALIFTVAYNSGNFRNSASKVVSDYITNVTPKDTISFDESTFSVTGFDGCSAYVSNQVKHTIGKENFKSFGFFGDAWTINDNLVRSGNGTYVFNSFSNFEKKDGIGIEEIRKDVKSAVTTTQSKLKIDMFQEGDIVNLFYEGSNSQQEAYEKGKGSYTSHVGIIKRSADGTLVLEHNIHGIIKKDSLSDLISGKLKSVKGSMLVSGIVRPKYEKIGLTVAKAPTKKAPAQKASLAGLGLLALLRRRKNGEAVTNEDINDKQKELEQKLEDLKKQLEDVRSEYDTKIAEKRKQSAPIQTSAPTQQEPVTKTVPNQAEIDKINNEYNKKINALKPSIKSKVGEYKKRIENMLNGIYKDLINSEDLEQARPTQADIDEYRELQKLKKLGTKRGQELSKYLKKWKLLATLNDDGYTSIVDLLDNISQRETEIEDEDTKDLLTEEEAKEIVDESTEVKGKGSADGKNITNISTEPVVAKINDKGEVEFSHLKARYIVEQIGGEFKVKRGNKYITNPNIDELEPGDIVEIDNLSFYMNGFYRLVFNYEQFKPRQQQLNLYVEENQTYANFTSVYSIFGEEKVKTPSQFEDIIDRKAALNVKAGDILTLHVDDQDGWNKSKKGGTLEQFKIYLKDKAGNIVYNLKSGSAVSEEGVEETFANMRLRAFQNWEAQGRPDQMDLGISVKVGSMLYGAPELLYSDGKLIDGDISIEEAKVILGKGYIENGNLTIDAVTTFNKDEVSKVYLGRLTKNNPNLKIPIVVFKVGENLVAFPITLKKSANPIKFDILLNGTSQEMVKNINQAIIDNKIRVEKLSFEDITIDYRGEIVLSEAAEKVREAFANKTTFVNASLLANNKYKVENLVNDASIRIDLSNIDSVFSAPKAILDLGSVEIKQPKEVVEARVLDIDEKASKLNSDLYDKVYVDNWDSIFKESTSNQFAPIIIDGYMEGKKAVIPSRAEGRSKYKDKEQVDWSYKRRDKKVLDKALEQIFDVETMKLKISKREKEQLGDNLIKEMTSYLIERENLAKQTKPKETEVKNGLDNIDESCNR